MTVAISPLTTEHVPESAALLDRWYARARKSLPHQSGRTTAPPAGEGLLGGVLAAPGAEAVLARGGGTLAGYLVATPLDVADDDLAALRAHPRSALVPYGAHALRGGRDGEDVLRALYAAVAERLVAQRRHVHYVDLPADEAVAAAWFRGGFGLERVRGLMAVRPRGRQPRGVEALSVRRAGPGDLDRIGRMAVEAARADRGTAVFRPQPERALAALRTHYADALADARSGAWIAARRGEEIGMVVLTPAASGPVVPDGCVELAEAYVTQAARGEGISRVLLATALAWAYDSGYRHITASWPAASPVSAGHWPAVGFRPVAYRLQRILDPRISVTAHR
ncbi:N-acetyltransferase family protein [Actinacidiphila sp. bgisy167]|uniref:GNAT family N-acetyltransferase n=1 Tax=Actinacidiphila sp. bgisy167 TaxID=3413797 RepID=UPI003D73F506